MKILNKIIESTKLTEFKATKFYKGFEIVITLSNDDVTGEERYDGDILKDGKLFLTFYKHASESSEFKMFDLGKEKVDEIVNRHNKLNIK